MYFMNICLVYQFVKIHRNGTYLERGEGEVDGVAIDVGDGDLERLLEFGAARLGLLEKHVDEGLGGHRLGRTV